MLSIAGQLAPKEVKQLSTNFDASLSANKQEDQFSLLLASDKISEGFNLNRAGTIINYDIPWNPTRVIQRVGRINRIGKKVFDELYLYNFFPTVQGASVIKSREIASQKMFLIHNTLGEDAKIFATDETPTASALYKRLNSVQEDEEESLSTTVRNQYEKIASNHADVIQKISNLPARVKTAKPSEARELCVLRRKGISLFAHNVVENGDVTEISFEQMLDSVECEPSTQRLNVSESFWDNYEKVKSYKPRFHSTSTENALEVKALNCLRSALRFYSAELSEHIPFIHTLILDLRDYLTLPKYTLRRLSQYELVAGSSKKDLQSFIKEISQLRHHLGDNYLDSIKEKVSKHKKEIIIAVENRS